MSPARLKARPMRRPHSSMRSSPGVLGGEMIARAPRGARQRRAREALAFVQFAQRRERLAPLRLVALVWRLCHAAKHKPDAGSGANVKRLTQRP